MRGTRGKVREERRGTGRLTKEGREIELGLGHSDERERKGERTERREEEGHSCFVSKKCLSNPKIRGLLRVSLINRCIREYSKGRK
jgi:hypothetical protein